MQLRVCSGYSNGSVAYAAGQLLEVSAEMGELLLRDSPGSFEVVAPERAGDPDGDPPEAAVESRDRRQRGGKAR